VDKRLSQNLSGFVDGVNHQVAPDMPESWGNKQKKRLCGREEVKDSNMRTINDSK
jgi:hypothetical protein